MGRAIVRDPELFLFDEPLSNLDAKLRNQMRIEIRALQQRLGVTSVYVTHDQVEAMTMADRIIVLNAGRVEQIGTPTEIYERPASTFVAGFMGAPPMNLMTAALVSGQLQVGGETKLPLTPPAVATDEVLVGYRPEDVRLGGDGSVVLDVQIIEELGANRLLHGQLGGQAFSISIGKDEQAQVGPQPITLPQDRVHFFHPERGTRL
jgi:sn-glycerol 3-phosphate transport system ATP-binding protein